MPSLYIARRIEDKEEVNIRGGRRVFTSLLTIPAITCSRTELQRVDEIEYILRDGFYTAQEREIASASTARYQSSPLHRARRAT